MDRVEIGNRLRIFIKEKFGTYAKGAAALGMKPPSLQTYLRGESLPGAGIISKLKELGCDTDWLLLVRDEPLGDRVEDKGNTEYMKKKDKIILEQVEEIQELKEMVKKLKVKLTKLERETEQSLNKLSRSEKSNPKRRKMTAKVV